VNQHETAAADITCVRIDDGEREPGRDGGIDGIATTLEHFEPRLRRQHVRRRHEPVFSLDRLPLRLQPGGAQE
jgi:hypothetical protein